MSTTNPSKGTYLGVNVNDTSLELILNPIATNTTYIGTSTYTSPNPMTLSSSSSLYIKGSPIAGSNVIITSGYSLNINSGNSFFGGDIASTGLLTSTSISTGTISSGAITSTGLLTSTSISTGAITSGAITSTGNSSFGDITSSGLLTSTSISTGAITSGAITSTGNSSFGDITSSGLLTSTSISTGTISSGAITSTGLLTSTSISTGTISSGAITSTGLLTSTSISTGAITSGAITSTGNSSFGDITSSGLLTSTSISTGTISSGAITSTGLLTSTSISTGTISSGAITSTGLLTSTSISTGTISSGAITSTGLLTSTSISTGTISSGAITSTGLLTSTSISTGTISSGAITSTGLLTSTSISTGTISSGAITSTGLLTSTSISTGTITSGAITSTGNSSFGDITSSGLLTSTSISTGTISSGAITSTGLLTSTSISTGAITSGAITSTGNSSFGDITSSGLLTSTSISTGTISSAAITSTGLLTSTSISTGTIISTAIASTGNSSFSGNVGIGGGRTVPLSKIEINESSSDTIAYSLRLRNRYGGSGVNPSGSGMSILFEGYRDSTSPIIASIIANKVNGDRGDFLINAGSLQFSTNSGTGPSYSDIPTVRMTITKTGDIGIGTTSPSTRLDVAGTFKSTSISTGTISSAAITSTGNSSFSGLLTSGSISTGTITSTDITSTGNSSFSGLLTSGSISTGTITSTDITSTGNSSFSGNVGIGTTNPSEKLEVSSVGTVNNQVKTSLKISSGSSVGVTNGFGVGMSFHSARSNDGGVLPTRTGGIESFLYAGHNTGDDRWGMRFIVRDNDDYITGITIRDSGNVGIGTASPSAKLDVSGTFKATSISTGTISSTAITSTGNSSFSGDVGIGTTSPRAKLDILAGDLIVRSSGENLNATLFLGTPNGANNALKAAIIARGKTSYSRSMMHFCLDNTSDNSSSFNASVSNSRMVIDSNGNVGIGTTTPSTKLDVFIGTLNSARVSSVAEFRGSQTNTTGETILRLGRGHHAGSSYAASAEFNMYKYDNSNTNANSALEIKLGAGANDNPDAIVMSLRANGAVGMGTTAPLSRLHVMNGGQTTARITGSNNNIQTDWPSGWDGGLATRDITCSGVYYATLTQRSDIRKKKDIITFTKGLNEVIQLRSVVFIWKKEFYNLDEEQFGFIAQEVEEIIPEIVGEDDSGYKFIRDAYAPIFVNAIKELNTKYEEEKRAHTNTQNELAKLKIFLQTKFPGEI